MTATEIYANWTPNTWGDLSIFRTPAPVVAAGKRGGTPATFAYLGHTTTIPQLCLALEVLGVAADRDSFRAKVGYHLRSGRTRNQAVSLAIASATYLARAARPRCGRYATRVIGKAEIAAVLRAVDQLERASKRRLAPLRIAEIVSELDAATQGK